MRNYTTQRETETDRHRQTETETDRDRQKQRQREAGRQAGRQAGSQTGRQTGRQAGRQADRQAGRQAGRQTDREAFKQAAGDGDNLLHAETSARPSQTIQPGTAISGETSKQTPWQRPEADYTRHSMPASSERQNPSSNGHSTPSQKAGRTQSTALSGAKIRPSSVVLGLDSAACSNTCAE